MNCYAFDIHRYDHPQLRRWPALGVDYGQERRLDQVAIPKQFALNLVQLIGVQPNRRKDRLAVGIAVLPDDDVTAAQVLEIVGERAQGAHNGVRIPASLVFDAVAFHRALA